MTRLNRQTMEVGDDGDEDEGEVEETPEVPAPDAEPSDD